MLDRYASGETYGSVFGDVGSAMEECRAELVSLLLCVEPSVQEAFETKVLLRMCSRSIWNHSSVPC